jgi:4-hydroxy-2-oxoheptanedioate aldolase
VVRVPWNDAVAIKRVLDIGGRTLLVPFVQSAAEARQAVAATRYPPKGIRGVSVAHRGNRFGRLSTYMKDAEQVICLLVQLETRAALDQIEEIAAIEGVDGIFIGPSDLAADLGHLGNAGHPEVQAAIAEACERIRAAGKPAGILTGVEADARRYLQSGFTFVAVGSDVGLLAAAAPTWPRGCAKRSGKPERGPRPIHEESTEGETQMSKVGFIGLGIMGRPMAGHLQAAGTNSSSATSARCPRRSSAPAPWRAARARRSRSRPRSSSSWCPTRRTWKRRCSGPAASPRASRPARPSWT